MVLQFKKASKSAAKARIALVGPTGSGKTMSALGIADGLARPGERIAVIDTERGSASLYADRHGFDVLELPDHSPDTYVEAIRAAEKAGYSVLVIDSLSHAWMGRDGALEQVDQAAKKSRSGNTFTAWRDVTPKHNALVDAMLQANMHLIATMRAKTEWVLDDGPGGKKTPRKVGLAPVQRDGVEYEFTIVGDITLEHDLVVSKTRWSEIADKIIAKPGRELGERILAWLSDSPSAIKTTAVINGTAGPTVPPGNNASSERDALKAELADHERFFGSRAELLKYIEFWPKTLPAARVAVERARVAREAVEAALGQSPFEQDESFDTDDPQASGDPSGPPRPGDHPPSGQAPDSSTAPPPKLQVVPSTGDAQEPGPSANKAPAAAQREPGDGNKPGSTTISDAKAAQVFVSISDFWKRLRGLGIDQKAVLAETSDLFGVQPGQLAPELRGVYVEIKSAGLSMTDVARDMIDNFGIEDMRTASIDAWVMYASIVNGGIAS